MGAARSSQAPWALLMGAARSSQLAGKHHGRCSWALLAARTMGAARRQAPWALLMGAARSLPHHGRCSWALLAGKHHGRCSWALLAARRQAPWALAPWALASTMGAGTMGAAHGRCAGTMGAAHGRWHHGLAGTMGAAHGCCKAPWHACKAPWHACKAHGPRQGTHARHMGQGMAQGKARDAMAWPNTTCKGKAWPKQGMQRHGIHRHNDRTTCTMLRL